MSRHRTKEASIAVATQVAPKTRPVNSYQDILNRACDLWDGVLDERIAERRVASALDVGRFMLDTLKVAIADRTNNLGGVLSYVNNLAASEKSEITLYEGFSLLEFAANEGLSEVEAKDRVQRLLNAGHLEQPSPGVFRLKTPVQTMEAQS